MLFAAVAKGRVKVYVGGAVGLQICELELLDNCSSFVTIVLGFFIWVHCFCILRNYLPLLTPFPCHGRPFHTRVISSGCCIGVCRPSSGSSTNISPLASSASSYVLATASDDGGVRLSRVSLTQSAALNTCHTLRCGCAVNIPSQLEPLQMLYGDSNVHEASSAKTALDEMFLTCGFRGDLSAA